MKKLLLLFILIPYAGCSQPRNYQQIVLGKIFSDQSLQAFFENREIIKLVKNDNCTFKIGTKLNIEERIIKVIGENKGKQAKSDALKFIDYENMDKYIVAEITLFNKNVIYSATYKKDNGRLTKIMANTTFVKSPRN